VPPHELLVDQPRGRLEIPAIPLVEEKREEVDLEEQVAELVEELLVVSRERGVRDLVRLLDGVRDDRPLGLLAIPRAVTAQPLRECLQLEQRPGEISQLSSWRSWSASSPSSKARNRPDSESSSRTRS
jgi:hypothetical protein